MENHESLTTSSETYSKPSEQNPQLPEIVPPVAGPDVADHATRRSPDFTGEQADGRVFLFNRWGIKYGVDDKAHAAALILSFIIMVLFAFVAVVGMIVERTWTGDAIKILGTGLTLTTGIAIGQSGGKGK